MVETVSRRKIFDGVIPENVVFGETLGEGKCASSKLTGCS